MISWTLKLQENAAKGEALIGTPDVHANACCGKQGELWPYPQVQILQLDGRHGALYSCICVSLGLELAAQVVNAT